jgi:hypothetical protein
VIKDFRALFFPKVLYFSPFHSTTGVAAMENGEEMRSPGDILSNALFCKFDLAVLTAPLTCACPSPVCQNDHLQQVFLISSNSAPKSDH